MADATTVAKLREVAKELRRQGFNVTPVPGWERRGAGSMRPRGRVEHHTASSTRGGNTASLRLVTFGRSDLRNALCNWYVARNGDIYLVAAGLAWHAGTGGWRGLSGNSQVSGTEAENNGVGEPWSERSLDAQAAISRTEARVFAYPTNNVCDHREWAPGRKIDRTGIHSVRWRRRLATPPPTPKPEEDMTPADHKQIQAAIRQEVDAAYKTLAERLEHLEAEVSDVPNLVYNRLQPKGGAPLGDEVDLLRQDTRGVRRILVAIADKVGAKITDTDRKHVA